MRVAGSYFRNDVSGLGADDASLPFADQALMALVSAQPTLTYSEWASQAPGSDTAWTQQSPTVDYQAFAITDYQLVAVATSASSEVQTLAVISPVLGTQQVVTAAFEGTPFSYQKTEAIYAQLDSAPTPQIYYLYWLSLRDPSDPKTGSTSLNYAATSVGGVLSYVLQIPIADTDRNYPATSFSQALSAQMLQGPLVIPATAAQQSTVPYSPGTAPVLILPAPVELPSAAAPASAASTGDTAKTLLLLGLGAAAAVYGYKYYQDRKARTA